MAYRFFKAQHHNAISAAKFIKLRTASALFLTFSDTYYGEYDLYPPQF